MTDAQRHEPPPVLKGRYRLVERLGAGGTAVVYRAHDETLGRDVAIKFLAPERVVGEEVSARFLREARAVARLAHPNIMAVFDVDREDTWLYLVLEHIPGKDLHTLLVEHGRPLPVRETLVAIRGTLKALAYAHQQGIVHRDIKPENIMITPDGQVKVTDFGLALVQGDIRLTRDGMIVGTALYMAPEAVTEASVDSRSDLYAVGAVCYELLTGRPLFSGDDLMAVLSQILNAPVTPPRAINLHIPPAVEKVIVKLLAKNPAERYASAEEVLAALPDPAEAEAFAAGEAEPVAAERASLSLVERIVRGSSVTEAPAPSVPDEEVAPPELTQELLIYAATEDTATAVEAERRRLAALLQSDVVESLNLLLSQAGVYEQTLFGNPQARMALSVLTSLARQTLQQARDLEANLHPTLLETLGLEPALENLANQAMRAHGLRITLALQRMPERLPPQVELALFRATQDALTRAIRHAQASQVTIRLERQAETVTFQLSDDGLAAAGTDLLRAARGRIEQLGGVVRTGIGAFDGFELTVAFAVAPPAELTPRELDVLQLLAEGLSNKAIGGALFVSPRTVNFHLDNIYSKLGVNSRTEAAIYALRNGLVHRPPGDAV